MPSFRSPGEEAVGDRQVVDPVRRQAMGRRDGHEGAGEQRAHHRHGRIDVGRREARARRIRNQQTPGQSRTTCASA